VCRVELTSGEIVFVKVPAAGMYPSLDDERDWLISAGDRLPVPQVLDHGVDGSLEWLAFERTPGSRRDATRAPRQPATTVPILARGLRRFHDTPLDGCPFDFTST
jgi:aminoglycoside phosphotransferase